MVAVCMVTALRCYQNRFEAKTLRWNLDLDPPETKTLYTCCTKNRKKGTNTWSRSTPLALPHQTEKIPVRSQAMCCWASPQPGWESADRSCTLAELHAWKLSMATRFALSQQVNHHLQWSLETTHPGAPQGLPWAWSDPARPPSSLFKQGI